MESFRPGVSGPAVCSESPSVCGRRLLQGNALLRSRSIFGQDLSSRATVHTDSSPCHSNKGVSCALSVGFRKEKSLPAHLVMVGVAHVPGVGSAALTLGPLPVCQAGLSLPQLPGHAAYHTAMLILSHVRDGESAQSRHSCGSQKHISREPNKTSFLPFAAKCSSLTASR